MPTSQQCPADGKGRQTQRHHAGDYVTHRAGRTSCRNSVCCSGARHICGCLTSRSCLPNDVWLTPPLFFSSLNQTPHCLRPPRLTLARTPSHRGPYTVFRVAPHALYIHSWRTKENHQTVAFPSLASRPAAVLAGRATRGLGSREASEEERRSLTSCDAAVATRHGGFCVVNLRQHLATT